MAGQDHQYAVDNVRKFIEVGGEEYASYHAHGYARCFKLDFDKLMEEAKAPASEGGKP